MNIAFSGAHIAAPHSLRKTTNSSNFQNQSIAFGQAKDSFISNLFRGEGKKSKSLTSKQLEEKLAELRNDSETIRCNAEYLIRHNGLNETSKYLFRCRHSINRLIKQMQDNPKNAQQLYLEAKKEVALAKSYWSYVRRRAHR